MNNLTKNFKKIVKTKWFWIITINIIVFIYACIVNVPLNETNDDTGMRDLAAGAYGSNNGYLVFINIILGKTLSLLYSMIPGINWYTVISILIVFYAYILIGSLLIDRMGIKIGVPIYAIFIRMIYAETLSVLQFTRISMLIGIIGFLYIFHYLTVDSKKKFLWIGSSAIWLCVLMRIGSFKMLLLYAFFIGLLLLVFSKRIFAKGQLKRYVIVFSVVFSVSGLLYVTDILAYKRNSEWNDYREYTVLRSKLVDYGFPDFNLPEYRVVYDQLGISEVDYLIYKDASLMYEDTLSTDELSKLVEIKENYPKEISKRELGKSFIKNLILDQYFYIALVFVALYFLSNKVSELSLLFIGNFAIYFGLYSYYFYIDRIVNRVMIPTSIVFILVALFCFKKENYKVQEKIISRSACVLLAFLLVFSTLFTSSRVNAEQNRVTKSALYETISESDDVYFIDFNAFRFNYKFFDAYNHFGEDYFSNVIHTGGWLNRTPTLNAQMEKLGISNFSSVIDREDVYFYTNNKEALYGEFISRHYTLERVNYSIVDYLDGTKIIDYNVQNKIKDKNNQVPIDTYEVSKFNDQYSQIILHFSTPILFNNNDAYMTFVNEELYGAESFRMYKDSYEVISETEYTVKVVVENNVVERLLNRQVYLNY